MTKKAFDKTNIPCDPKRLNAFSLKTSDNGKKKKKTQNQ